MTSLPPDPEHSSRNLKRRLRAAFSADIANFSGNVSVSETRAFGNLSAVLKAGREELDRYEGIVISVPGDALFALFESVVNAVQCAIAIQTRLAAEPNLGDGMRFRIGIHLGDVLFDGDLPFGETLNIAARLQALADPGGTLVSGAVADAVCARVAATFEARGVPKLKNIPRRISTYAINSYPVSTEEAAEPEFEPLDHTMRLPRRAELEASKPAEAEAPPVEQSELAASSQVAPKAAPQPERLVERLARIAPVTSQAAEPPEPAPNETSPPTPSIKRNSSLASRFSTLDEPPTAEAIAQFAEAFAVHLGPVGRVMTARKAETCASLGDLLAALEREIPTAAEQHAFRSRILQRFGP
jgi:class 3 adenylate cyclase